jgi:CMP-N-acetylneuraminic acid synthetase
MIDGKRILAVVPARGGSKGLKLKNLMPLSGVPLVELAGRVIKHLPYIDRAVVSTDHPQIAEAAKKGGLEAPFYRPEELSGDFISDTDVLTHALMCMEIIDQAVYDIIVMLQPTSPLRKPEHITETVKKLIAGNYDAVWTVSPTDPKYHPLKQLLIEDGQLKYYDPRGAQVIARQQLSPLYHRNGAAYAISRNCLLGKKSIKGDRSAAVVIADPMISIDHPQDFKLAELYLSGILK